MLESNSRAKLIQSYIMNDSFDWYEKKILWKIVKMMTITAEKKELDERCKVKKELCGGVVEIPISELIDIMKCDTIVELDKFIGALKSLTSKKYTLKDKVIHVITLPEVRRDEGLIVFRLEEEVFEALQDIANSYQKYGSFIN